MDLAHAFPFASVITLELSQDLITETHSTVERGRGRQRARKSESRYNDRPKEREGEGVGEAAIEKFTV